MQIGRIPIMLRSDKCVLHGKSEEEIAELKECAYDPGGYFIVRGTEKVILMQEQLSKNRVIIELDSKGHVSAAITSSTHDRKSRCNIFFKNHKLYLKHNSLGDEIPIVIVLKAMGIESDQEIVQLVGGEQSLMDLFSGSLEEPYSQGVYNQQQALQFIGERIMASRFVFFNVYMLYNDRFGLIRANMAPSGGAGGFGGSKKNVSPVAEVSF